MQRKIDHNGSTLMGVWIANITEQGERQQACAEDRRSLTASAASLSCSVSQAQPNVPPCIRGMLFAFAIDTSESDVAENSKMSRDDGVD
jgi:hypothetical protein